MANKKRKNEMQQANQRKAQMKRYEAASKNFNIINICAIGMSVLILLLFFVNFADVYNTVAGSKELGASGWEFFVAGISGNYSSPTLAGGFLAVPFYSHAQEWTEVVGTLTVVAVFVVILNLIIQVVTVLKKFHVLSIVSAVLSLATAVLLIVIMAKAIDMNNAKIISDYCNNPACEVRSFAIFPALAAVVSCVLSGSVSFRHAQASVLLK